MEILKSIRNVPILQMEKYEINKAFTWYNEIGQLVFSTINYQNDLIVSSLAAGVYFYEVVVAK